MTGNSFAICYFNTNLQISISAGTIISGGWTQTDTDGSRGTCRDFEKERRRSCSKRNAAPWKRDQHAYTGRTAP